MSEETQSGLGDKVSPHEITRNDENNSKKRVDNILKSLMKSLKATSECAGKRSMGK